MNQISGLNERKALMAFFNLSENDLKNGLANIADTRDKWYAHEMDESFYGEKGYIFDAYDCFITYSKLYAKKTVETLNHYQIEPEIILDYGAGLGMSTKILAKSFPESKVYYLNLKGSQFDFAQAFIDESNVEFVTSPPPRAKVICAWEFFEHIKRPIELAEKMMSMNPVIFSISNSFGGYGFGHYRYFGHDNIIVHHKKIGRMFNQAMRDHGFEVTPYSRTFWNGRPTIWARVK